MKIRILPAAATLAALLSATAFADQKAAIGAAAPAVSTAPAASQAPGTMNMTPAAAAPAAPASDVSVTELSLGTNVQDRQIVGKADQFPAGTESVYCLTAVEAKNAPTGIKHVWYKDGARLGEVSLAVKSSSWRTWSYHFVQAGSWKVEVQDEAGTVLQSAEFTVAK